MGSLIFSESSESPFEVSIKRNRNIEMLSDSDGGHISSANSAVYVHKLCKSYGNIHVLRNFCMDVQKGTIYGLLGASGCGKTTVLSTLVGTKKWDSGNILVLGESPGKIGKRIGYMPQEEGLYGQLSIREMIGFYRRVYNMNNEDLKERFDFLVKLLDLPSDFRLIQGLSGGQKRRASLAIALIHCPPLLVLDEPTVGMDPLLRRRVWNHLCEMVTTLKTTVIITTHYIEEARLANKIGVMRGGRLLVQDSPTNLLRTFQCSLLEEVVLQLCRKDSPSKLPDNGNEESGDLFATKNTYSDDILNGTFRNSMGFDSELNVDCQRKESGSDSNLMFHPKWKQHFTKILESLQRIWALMIVIFLTLIRHPVFIFLILLLPTAHGTLTLLTIGTKPKQLNFGVVNHDIGNSTTECDQLRHAESSCDFSALSCKFINQLSVGDLLRLTPYEDENSALQEVRLGRAWGYFVFGENYSQHTTDLLSTNVFATNESIDGSRISMHMDFSEYICTFFVIKDVYAAYMDYLRSLAVSCGMGGENAKAPLNFRTPVYGRHGDNYTDFLVPGVIVSCLLAILITITSVLFVSDRKQGNLSRAQVAGLSTADVLIGHMLMQALIALAQTFLWTLVPYFFFGFTIVGPIWLYMLVIVMVGLCGAAIGILLGIVCNDEVECLIIGFFWVPIFLLFGGAFWPSEYVMPIWKQFGYILPATLPIMTLRSVIIRGLGFTHNLVWPGIAVSFAWIVILLILIVIAYKRLQ